MTAKTKIGAGILGAVAIISSIVYFSGSTSNFKTIPKNQDGGWYKPVHNLQPGDTVKLEGDYSYINIENVNGAPGKPIVFIAVGPVRVGYNTMQYSWIISGHDIVIDGQNNLTIGGADGSFNTQGLGFSVSNFEVKGVEIKNTQVGFFSNRTDANRSNIYIHDNYVHALDNPQEAGRSEGVYIGNTEPATSTSLGSFDNVRIENNRFENLAGDGIQVARTKNLVIKNNIIKGYGGANLEQQRTAIILGGCSSGTIEGNQISEGTGSPIQLFGGGETYVRNNTAKLVSTSPNEDGFYINGKCGDQPLKVHLLNNSIDKVSREFIRDDSKSVVENVGNVFGVVVTPPPPPPALTIEHKGYYSGSDGKRKYYVMYTNKTWVFTNSKYQPL